MKKTKRAAKPRVVPVRAGVGAGAPSEWFKLDIVIREGDSQRVLGSMDVPAKTAEALNATGGATMQLDWVGRKGDAREVLASEPLPTIAALKGAAQ